MQQHTPRRAIHDPLVLLVSTNRETRELYSDYLTAEGFRTARAGQGYEALEKAIELTPEVVVTAVEIPGLDGLALRLALKRDERTRHAAVIVLGPRRISARRRWAERAGFDAVLFEPCQPEDLTATICQALVRHRSPRVSYKVG